jgi:hypothetical protein
MTPEIASDGIHDSDVTDDSIRMIDPPLELDLNIPSLPFGGSFVEPACL